MTISPVAPSAHETAAAKATAVRAARDHEDPAVSIREPKHIAVILPLNLAIFFQFQPKDLRFQIPYPSVGSLDLHRHAHWDHEPNMDRTAGAPHPQRLRGVERVWNSQHRREAEPLRAGTARGPMIMQRFMLLGSRARARVSAFAQ